MAHVGIFIDMQLYQSIILKTHLICAFVLPKSTPLAGLCALIQKKYLEFICIISPIIYGLCLMMLELGLWIKLQISNYEKEIEEMKHMTRQEYVASLRRYLEMPSSSSFWFSSPYIKFKLTLMDCHFNAGRVVGFLGVHPYIEVLLGNFYYYYCLIIIF